MKGIVFIALNQMIEEKIGISTWEQLLDLTGIEGIYTSFESYPDEEIMALVVKLSEIAEIPINDLVSSFGEYLFTILASKYPIFIESEHTFFGFLISIDSVIHKEVKKLYDSPNLPTIACKEIDKSTLLMRYQSPRKLCLLAEGLIRGAAQHYNVKYQLAHEQCMHKAADHCVFRISLDE